MTKRMLIDATHPEETRVVVLDGNRLEEFDVETSTKKTLKGNIYLAKVVRVEPSLQAAFVDFGGNRHGFLAFSEIHPDYYQIPVADRQRLLELAAQEAAEEAEREEAEASGLAPVEAPPAVAEAEQASPQDGTPAEAATDLAPVVTTADEAPSPEPGGEAESRGSAASAAEASAPPEPPAAVKTPPLHAPAPPEPAAEAAPEPRPPAAQPARIETERLSLDPDASPPAADAEPAAGDEAAAVAAPSEPEREAGVAEAEAEAEDTIPAGPEPVSREIETVAAEPAVPETVGGGNGHDGADEDRPRRIPPKFLRQYKIQEVIKRRQILLVQVVKEERGNKGAALTTYLSLAGRYCVLMPNTPRGGGISRKITSPADRKRLREIMNELEIPDGMGLIVRTAGANRPKAEIKRDCEYLLRLWDDIREKTLQSVAPCLIYEEANLIKRAIRDVYSRDIDEVIVDGEEAYKAAKEFMRMLMPSHARKVQLYRDGGVSLFARAGVEAQLDAMHNKRVELKSGGYIVIDQTEALVAIDVNSGRATRERNIEETALKTNLEAADEIARQIRLRDLAGLIVIDFIDMENSRNNAAVERRLKEALKQDRARIQVGRISHFGLLEMSRQRLRPSLTESSFVTCPTCNGSGLVRSVESSSVAVLRAIEEEAAKRRAAEILVRCAGAVALYLLNHKRARLAQLEETFGLKILFAADDSLAPPAVRIERTKPALAAPPAQPVAPLPPPVSATEEEETDEAEAVEAEGEEEEASAEARADGAEEGRGATEAEREGRRRRRRRRRRGGRREDGQRTVPPGVGDQPELATLPVPPMEEGEAMAPAPAAALAEPAESGAATESEARGPRRGRRGGRRRPDLPGAPPPTPAYVGATPANPFVEATVDLFEALEEGAAAPPAPPSGPSAPAAVSAVPIIAAPPPEAAPEPSAPPVAEEAPGAPEAEPPVAAEPAPAQPSPPQGPIASAEIKPIVVDEVIEVVPKKRGWWRR
ncbi:Rne/Rng family ribonuclease [Elioraea thermophila]|uniref:Rne/Rng family ribonuclease n=1 Tax=Elioraea thermophila TaxID=2185104 RepID=UPI000DF29BBA|nr:ribonuclease E/G [Elioraea thermophila]